MATLHPEDEPFRKRQKISSQSTSTSTSITTGQQLQQLQQDSKMAHDTHQAILDSTSNQDSREVEVGITQYVHATSPGFTGTLKKRYVDFQVFEIDPNGNVVHLTDDYVPETKTAHSATKAASVTKPSVPQVTEAPKVTEAAATAAPKIEQPQTTFTLSSQYENFLIHHFGASCKNEIIALHKAILANPGSKPSSYGQVVSDPITDRHLRGHIHGEIRRMFNSVFETSLDGQNGIVFTAASSTSRYHGRGGSENNQQQNTSKLRGKLGWDEAHGGEYLHFTLYKENKDTMEVIVGLSKDLRVKPKDFAFAGTKDRRAVTSQRVSVFRQTAKNLVRLNPNLRSAAVGNFKYEKQKLELGELQGNVFVITLRDCDFGAPADMDEASRLEHANEILSRTVKNLQESGFLNYFGLQRFGTFGIGTDVVGKKCLQQDFEGACDALLNYNEKSLVYSDEFAVRDKVSRDDVARAQAIHMFRKSGMSKQALERMPRKFSAEIAIIRHLSNRHSRKDFLGGINGIPRNLKTMYVHAYQSLVWNTVASERWSRHGSKVIKGDLILINTQAEKAAEKDEYDENGEVIIRPAEHDTAVNHDDIYQRARALTAEEAESGKYFIFDVVLPTPGFDVNYPDNDIGDFYKEFMLSERGGGIDPANMRRPQKDFSLSGAYRPFLAKVSGDMQFETMIYYDANQQLVETDLDKLDIVSFHTRQNAENAKKENEKLSSPRSHLKYQQTRDQEIAVARAKYMGSNNLAAWQSLSGTIAEDDRKVAADADAQIAKMKAEDVKGPAVSDTWIQTDEQSSKRRTGVKSIEVLGEVPAVEEEDEVDASLPERLVSTSKIHATPSAAAKPSGQAASTTEFIPTAVPSTPEKSTKRGVEEISTSRPSTPQSWDGSPEPGRLAVVLKFSLGSSQYATMALRELMKAGGVRTYKPDYSSGR